MINSTLPQSLWTKASALVSAMWGVGTLLGPAAGGLFAQYGSWRWAFGVLVVLAVAIAVLVPFALPARPGVPPVRDRDPGVVTAAARFGGVGDQRRGCPAKRGVDHRSGRAGRGSGRSVLDCRSPCERGGPAAHGLSARSAQVDLSHPRHVDGRDDGRPVRAVLRPAAGAPGTRGGGLPRCGAGGRVDDERDRERIGDQDQGGCAHRRRRTAGDGCGPGAGGGQSVRGRVGPADRDLGGRAGGDGRGGRHGVATPVGVGDGLRRRRRARAAVRRRRSTPCS